MNKKPVIGILPTSNYLLTNDTFKDTYRFGNNYVKRIVDNGGIPLLIPYYDNKVILDALDMCDGLLLPGGEKVLPVVFEVLDYFYKNDKPILGICLGMQTLGMYSMKLDNIDEKIIKVIDNGVNHWPKEILRDNNDVLAHDLIVDKESLLYRLLNKERIIVNSVHKCTITKVGSKFRVIATSEDGLIEGIEAIDKKFVLGVQFHPEVLDQYNVIFEDFINKCKGIE